MESFVVVISSSLTPQILASIIGGLLGALASFDYKRYGWQLSIVSLIVAVVFSAAMGEYLSIERGHKSFWGLVALNFPLGMMVGAAIDVVRINHPKFIERLVVGIATNGVSIVIESVITKLSLLLGVKPKKIDLENDTERKDEEKDVT